MSLRWVATRSVTTTLPPELKRSPAAPLVTTTRLLARSHSAAILTGFSNTATGVQALSSNTTENVNTATGLEALRNNIYGEDNTANGYRAFFANTSGDDNTAIGILALSANTSGAFNTALGRGAGSNVSTANNVISIGISGENVSNSCYIGQIYSNVQPQVGTDPDLVTINSDGRLGRATVSSR